MTALEAVKIPGMHHQQSHVRIASDGTPRRLYSGDGNAVLIETQRPKIGGRNVFLSEPGLYVLASEEGSFRSLACTQAYQSSVEIFDWKYQPPGSKAPLVERRVILQMAPPILGQWPLDANFSQGLVVRIAAQGSGSPFLTIVWFLASDIGSGANGNGSGARK